MFSEYTELLSFGLEHSADQDLRSWMDMRSGTYGRVFISCSLATVDIIIQIKYM